MKIVKRIKKNEEGAALVEFAFAAPFILFTFVMGLEFGYQTFVRTITIGTMQEVAREGSFETASPGIVEGKARAKLLKYRPENLTITIRNFNKMSNANNPEILTSDVDRDGRLDVGDCWLDTTANQRFDLNQQGMAGLGQAGASVEYVLTAEFPRIFTVTSFLMNWMEGSLSSTNRKNTDNFNVTQRVVVQREPFAVPVAPQQECRLTP
jgi:Flp pilus assembly pilin Flp